jgi:hypothetical protein
VKNCLSGIGHKKLYMANFYYVTYFFVQVLLQDYHLFLNGLMLGSIWLIAGSFVLNLLTMLLVYLVLDSGDKKE